MTPIVFGCAYALDVVAGDPEWLPHPVRGMGRLISAGEAVANPGEYSSARDFIHGAIVTVTVVGITFGAATFVLRGAALVHPGFALAVEILLAWTALATGSLLSEARRVVRAMENGDLDGARQRLSGIVGRDTAALPESEVARAVIETLAESTCDGIVAPMCYLAVGGVPGALAYKAVNTLDSMIGHREPPYTYFGKLAARLDDVTNYVPARLSALAITVAAAWVAESPGAALRVWRRDHAQHSSPNAGHPEAAMAGALRVRLGGINTYDGVPKTTPTLGSEGAAPTIAAARAACRVVAAASFASFLAVISAMFGWRYLSW